MFPSKALRVHVTNIVRPGSAWPRQTTRRQRLKTNTNGVTILLILLSQLVTGVLIRFLLYRNYWHSSDQFHHVGCEDEVRRTLISKEWCKRPAHIFVLLAAMGLWIHLMFCLTISRGCVGEDKTRQWSFYRTHNTVRTHTCVRRSALMWILGNGKYCIRILSSSTRRRSNTNTRESK